MSRKSAVPIILTLLISFLLAACGGAQEAEPDEPLTIRITQNPFLSNAPLIIAEAEGFYDEQGLQVEFVPFQRTAEALPALTQGEIDVWAGATDAAVWNLIAGGANVRLVANKGYYATGGCYVRMLGPVSLQEAGGLSNPDAIYGGQISYGAGGVGEYWYKKVFEDNGLDFSQVENVTVPPANMVDVAASGEVLLISGIEPNATRALRTGQVYVVREISEDVPDFEFAHILFGPSILEDNPEIGRRFMLAYLKAVRQYSEGKTERNLDLLAEGLSLDRDLLEEACWPEVRPDLLVQYDSMEFMQTWDVANSYQDRVLTPEEMIDSQFVEYALETLGE